MKITLGSTQTDQLTGFTGVVTGITHWITGCDRYQLSPAGLDKDGNVQKPEWFDEVQLDPKQWAAMIAEPTKKTTGGPREAPRRAPDPR